MTAAPPAVGFITRPAWFDPAPAEFPTVRAAPVRTQQAPLPLPDLDYRLESVARTEPEMTLCARLLSTAGCDLIAQAKTPFASAGRGSEGEARDRCARIAEAAGVPVLMTGLAIIDALRALKQSVSRSPAPTTTKCGSRRARYSSAGAASTSSTPTPLRSRASSRPRQPSRITAGR